MRKFLIILLLIPFGHLKSQVLRTVKPIFTEEEALLLPGIEGKWSLSDDEHLIFQKSGDNFYKLTIVEGNDTSMNEAIITQ